MTVREYPEAGCLMSYGTSLVYTKCECRHVRPSAAFGG
jgi:hypothetical protein